MIDTRWEILRVLIQRNRKTDRIASGLSEPIPLVAVLRALEDLISAGLVQEVADQGWLTNSLTDLGRAEYARLAASSLGIDIAGATARVEKKMTNAPRRISKIAVRIPVPVIPDERQCRKLEEAAHACPVHNVLKVDAPVIFE